jgi:hypothetical protein
VLELICTVGILLPDALRWHPQLTVIAAAVLAAEALVFIWVHLQYAERAPILMSAVLALVMAFVAYGRLILQPIS